MVDTFLNTGDFALLKTHAKTLWETQRLALGSPVATILRYTEYPNPESLSAVSIIHSGLNISENIVGRSLNLVEGILDNIYIVTGYNATTISVSSANFLTDGFTTDCTFHIDGISYQKLISPTIVQVLSVGSESLVDRDVAYYNLTEKEMIQFNNELNISDKRFAFFDITVVNDDVIILAGQQYAVYKVKFNPVYAIMTIYGKSLRKS